MSSPLSGAPKRRHKKFVKLDKALSNAINTYSEVLSVLKRALAEKDSTVVSATFVLQIIDDGYKHLTYSFKHLGFAFDAYYNAISQ